jgi:hypothetical protein
MTVYLNRGGTVNLFCTPVQRNNLVARDTFCSACRTYFRFTAMAEISIRALLTKAAAWMVARAGLGSGITLL